MEGGQWYIRGAHILNIFFRKCFVNWYMDTAYNYYCPKCNFYDKMKLLLAKKGVHKLLWNGSKYLSGIYFVQIISENHIMTKRMTLIK